MASALLETWVRQYPELPDWLAEHRRNGWGGDRLARALRVTFDIDVANRTALRWADAILEDRDDR